PEVWDVVRIIVAPTEAVLTVKLRALEALFPEAELHEDFLLKLRGWEILEEAASLTDAGVVDGSILLLTHRRGGSEAPGRAAAADRRAGVRARRDSHGAAGRGSCAARRGPRACQDPHGPFAR